MIDDQIIEVLKIVIPFVFGGSIGGLIGFKIGVNKTIKQKEIGGDNSTMTQIGEIRHG